jgi:hypothetical protein
MADLRLEGFVSGGASLRVCASCGRVWVWVQVLLAATLMSSITLGGMVLHLVLHTRDPTVHGGAGEYIPLGALLVRQGPTTHLLLDHTADVLFSVAAAFLRFISQNLAFLFFRLLHSPKFSASACGCPCGCVHARNPSIWNLDAESTLWGSVGALKEAMAACTTHSKVAAVRTEAQSTTLFWPDPISSVPSSAHLVPLRVLPDLAAGLGVSP